jgi:hypothetical protein
VTHAVQVLDCYAMMASRDKGEVEEALARLHAMAAEEPDSVPVLLCMATAFTLLKQTPKARNQLKRVSKIPYKPGEGGGRFKGFWWDGSAAHSVFHSAVRCGCLCGPAMALCRQRPAHARASCTPAQYNCWLRHQVLGAALSPG